MRSKTFSFLTLLLAAVFLSSSADAAAPLMVEKNLFAQDRKPPSPESATAPAQPTKPGMALSNIQLDGVMIQGGSRKAILRLKGQQPGAKQKAQSPFVTVREGQQVGDFRVSKIEPKSVSFEKEGQTFTIDLFAANKVVNPAAPPAPAASAPSPAPIPGQPPQSPGHPAHRSANPPNQPGMNPQLQAAPGQPPPQQMVPPDAQGQFNPALNQQNVVQPQGDQMMPEPGIQDPGQEIPDEEQ